MTSEAGKASIGGVREAGAKLTAGGVLLTAGIEMVRSILGASCRGAGTETWAEPPKTTISGTGGSVDGNTEEEVNTNAGTSAILAGSWLVTGPVGVGVGDGDGDFIAMFSVLLFFDSMFLAIFSINSSVFILSIATTNFSSASCSFGVALTLRDD